MQLFLQINNRYIPVDINVQLEVDDNRLTGYFIGDPLLTSPAFVAVAVGANVSVGSFTNGSIFNKLLTS